MNIENKKQFATILLAVGLGLVAAVGVSQYVQNNIQNQTKLLAQEYQKKNASLIQEIEITKKTIGQLVQQQQALQRQLQERPQVVVTEKPKEEPKKPVDMGGFAGIMPKGKRALTILIDSLSAVGGLVKAGDAVDIIAHLSVPANPEMKEGPKNITTILFQNIQVLAVGAMFSIQDASPEMYAAQQQSRSLNITLALSPEEAGLLSFAQSHGRLQLSLRSPLERETEVLQIASWETLSEYALENQGTDLEIIPTRKPASPLPQIEEAPAPVEEEPSPVIQIFRGGREF